MGGRSPRGLRTSPREKTFERPRYRTSPQPKDQRRAGRDGAYPAVCGQGQCRVLREPVRRAILCVVNDGVLMIKLRRLLRSRGASTDDVDDLIQDAFLRLQIYCREHEVHKPEAFLVRTVLNLATDRRRSRVHTQHATDAIKALQLVCSSPPADDVLAAQERLQRMKSALDRMSPRRREVFVLNRIEGYSFPQIARQLGITLSAVEKHAAKAVLEMTDWMEGEEGTET
jgi:RNA polymerase sigma factor (sigma-70 family)